MRWVGSLAQIKGKAEEIAVTCLEFLEAQPTKRQERLDAEARRREEARLEERRRRVDEARKEQLEHAFRAAEAYERSAGLRRFLAVVDNEREKYDDPYRERAAVWLKVVREEMEKDGGHLRVLGECLSPGWRGWPPDWWPDDVPPGEGE